MSVVAFHVDIEADPARVWRWLANCERLRDWMPEVVETTFEARDDPPEREAAPFVRTVRKGRRLVAYAGRVTVHEPPHRLAVRLAGEREAIDMNWRLRPFGTGTRLDFELATSPASAWGAMRELLSRAWASRRMRTRLEALKRLAERARPDDAATSADTDPVEPILSAPVTAQRADEAVEPDSAQDRDQEAA